MYSNRQSVMFRRRRRSWSEAFPHGNRTRRPQRSRQTHWTEPMYSNRQSPLNPNAQRRVAKSGFHYGRPYRRGESPIVDRPLHLRETPAPFTSRSPGITTLGPSCTPSRQLGSVVRLSKAQRRIIETCLFGSQTYNLDVVPTGSWAHDLDHPTKKWFGRGHLFKGCSLNRQLDSQRRRWESNPLHAVLQTAAVPSGSSVLVPAPGNGR